MAQRIGRVLPTLTRSHRQMAEYVLAHPLQAATMPIDELAATVGVSVATANRFARALEFEGYAQFRAALVLGFEATLAPVERLRSKLAHRATAVGVFAAALDEAGSNIDLTRQSLDARSCEAGGACHPGGAAHLHHRFRQQRLAGRPAAALPRSLPRQRPPGGQHRRLLARRPHHGAPHAPGPGDRHRLSALHLRHRPAGAARVRGGRAGAGADRRRHLAAGGRGARCRCTRTPPASTSPTPRPARWR